MADEIKTDAAKVEGDVTAAAKEAEAVAKTGEGWVETHWVWIAGLGGVVLGFVIAHFTHW